MKKALARVRPLVTETSSDRSGVREVIVGPIFRWATQFDDPARPVLLTIPGSNAEERETLLNAYLDPRYASLRSDAIEDVQGERTRDWLTVGAVESFVQRVSTLRVPAEVRAGMRLPAVDEWEILWGLMRVDPFIVEEPLRSLVDQSWYLVSEAHKALWEARFLDRENADKTKVIAFVGAMSRWMMGRELSVEDVELLAAAGIQRRVERDEEKLDLACFILTLAAQNGLLNRVVMAFDGLEDALRPAARPGLRQLLGVVRVADRWVHMGCSPIGLFVGAPSDKAALQQLRKLNPHLADRVTAGLQWTN